MSQFLNHYMRGLGMSTRANSLAFGYSVAVTASFGALSHTAGGLSILHLAMFVVGPGIAFAAVTALVTRGFREPVEIEPRMVMAVATSLNLVSISAGVAVAAAIGWAIGGWVAWLLGSLLATLVYLGMSALEVALARTLHIVAGSEEALEDDD